MGVHRSGRRGLPPLRARRRVQVPKRPLHVRLGHQESRSCVDRLRVHLGL